MEAKREKWNYDPARKCANVVAGTPAGVRDDPAALPGCGGSGDWRSGADEVALVCGTPDCNSIVRGHSVNRSKTRPGTPHADKRVAEE